MFNWIYFFLRMNLVKMQIKLYTISVRCTIAIQTIIQLKSCSTKWLQWTKILEWTIFPVVSNGTGSVFFLHCPLKLKKRNRSITEAKIWDCLLIQLMFDQEKNWDSKKKEEQNRTGIARANAFNQEKMIAKQMSLTKSSLKRISIVSITNIT